MNYEEKVKLINNYFKKIKAEKIYEIKIVDYEANNIYIVLNYFKKENLCKFSWIDLNLVDSKNYIDLINYQIINVNYKCFLGEYFNNGRILKKYIVEDEFTNYVEINFYVDNNNYTYLFSR